jgi:DNA-binding beta-propeller fold protein YncE
MRKILRTSCLAIVVLFGFVALTCDEDCPVCPKEPEPVPVEHYRLYAISGLNPEGLLMSIDVPADTVVDSVRVDYNSEGLFVTPDGERLLVLRYLDVAPYNRVEIYSARDLSLIGNSDRYGAYFFDGGDNYGILQTSDIFFIDPVTLQPIDSILTPAPLGYIGFLDTVTNRFFVPVDLSAGGKVYVIDCIGRTLTDSIFDLPGGNNVIGLAYNWLTDDLYYFTRLYSGWSQFIQFDIETDTVLVTIDIVGSTGGISITPDGKTIFMTDGGNCMLGYVPMIPIWVINSLTNRPIAWIAPFVYPAGEQLSPCIGGSVVITPDMTRAYLDAPMSAGGTPPIPVIDIKTNQIIKTIFPQSMAWTHGAAHVALGPVPGN